MKQITFLDRNETFNIMAQDDAYMVCSRVYTAEESSDDCSKYDKGLRESVEYYYSVQDECNDFEDYFDTEDYLGCVSDYEADYGSRPIEYEEDSQCYTLIDLKNKWRGPDDCGNAYNYLDKKIVNRLYWSLTEKVWMI